MGEIVLAADVTGDDIEVHGIVADDFDVHGSILARLLRGSKDFILAVLAHGRNGVLLAGDGITEDAGLPTTGDAGRLLHSTNTGHARKRGEEGFVHGAFLACVHALILACGGYSSIGKVRKWGDVSACE